MDVFHCLCWTRSEANASYCAHEEAITFFHSAPHEHRDVLCLPLSMMNNAGDTSESTDVTCIHSPFSYCSPLQNHDSKLGTVETALSHTSWG